MTSSFAFGQTILSRFLASEAMWKSNTSSTSSIDHLFRGCSVALTERVTTAVAWTLVEMLVVVGVQNDFHLVSLSLYDGKMLL